MRKGSHTQYDIKYHIVWITKYRYKVLNGKIAYRLRELLRQGCEARRITIIKGSISKEHVHMLVSCPPNISVSDSPYTFSGSTFSGSARNRITQNMVTPRKAATLLISLFISIEKCMQKNSYILQKALA